jgi:hypothetical protein
MAAASEMKGPPPDNSDRRIDLSVPGVDSHLGVIRTVVGRSAMISGFTFDGIEDFSLAVHEAAALLLTGTPARIDMTMWADGEQLMVELRSMDGDGTWPTRDLAEDIRWNLLNALCDRVWALDPGIGIGLSQVKR